MGIQRPLVIASLAIALTVSAGLASTAAQAAEGEKSFEVYGFVQLDYVQDFDRVNPDWDSTLRPSKIPTIDGFYGSDGQAILSARQTRLGVQGNLPVEGSDLYTRFEFDLFGVGNDAGQTTFRLRHAYGQWKNWLAGQTNSLFMDGDIFPNVIDYWGPAGMVFLRNPQIRWTPINGANSFAVAIEQPSNDIDSGKVREIDPGLAESLQGDEKYPDLTAQFRMNRDWGHLQFAGILRDIGYDTANNVPPFDNTGNNPSGSETGWGLDLTGTYKTTDMDAIRAGVVYGHGIASYMNDGGVDLAPECDLDPQGDCIPNTVKAKAVPLLGVSAYYDHYWNSEYSTSFGYAQTSVDNQSGQQADAFNAGRYASVNLLYKPAKQVMTGIEALWGEREDNNGDKGNDVRVQVSFQYKFSSKDFEL